METTVSWTRNSRPDNAREAAACLDDAVTSIRNRGHTRRYALQLAAQALGLKFRRARALLYGDSVAVLDDELRRIQSAYLKLLDAEAEDLEARAAELRERRRRLQADDP